jgi:diaminopimelate epimerase
VVDPRAVVSGYDGGTPFYKMSGSGNDFVVIDARETGPGEWARPERVQRVCARGTGVGADGIVFLQPSTKASVQLAYLNADGSRAAFCGNATLCTTRLSFDLGLGRNGELTIETDEGVVPARMRGLNPEIDLPRVIDVRDGVPELQLHRGETRMGFARVGVPHLVIRCDDARLVDVVGRGRPLRSHPGFSEGANVNFVSRSPAGGWMMRTYERGVEAETLACGSGAVASAILLSIWDEVQPSSPVEIVSSSGLSLTVRLERTDGGWIPSLSGEGRIVFRGTLGEV